MDKYRSICAICGKDLTGIGPFYFNLHFEFCTKARKLSRERRKTAPPTQEGRQ